LKIWIGPTSAIGIEKQFSSFPSLPAYGDLIFPFTEVLNRRHILLFFSQGFLRGDVGIFVCSDLTFEEVLSFIKMSLSFLCPPEIMSRIFPFFLFEDLNSHIPIRGVWALYSYPSRRERKEALSFPPPFDGEEQYWLCVNSLLFPNVLHFRRS